MSPKKRGERKRKVGEQTEQVKEESLQEGKSLKKRGKRKVGEQTEQVKEESLQEGKSLKKRGKRKVGEQTEQVKEESLQEGMSLKKRGERKVGEQTEQVKEESLQEGKSPKKRGRRKVGEQTEQVKEESLQEGMSLKKRGERKVGEQTEQVKEESAREEETCKEMVLDDLRERKSKRGGVKKFIGAHMSISGGIWHAVQDSLTIGGRSFGLFLGSQRSWQRPPLDGTAAAKFREACARHSFEPAYILPHGSYLMNCGSPKQDVFEKSQAMLVDELNRCSALGLSLFNLHPGASLGSITTEQCIEKIAQAINHAHRQTSGVVTVLENMSGQGSTVGGQLSELRGIIDKVRDKSRVGVCLDTCHAFAAGYDLSATGGVKSVLEEFDKIVGLQYLRAVHLNDSKGGLGCNLDRHEDIGRGKIGLATFRDIVNEPLLDNIPLILETPGRPGFEYAEQIALLYSLCED
ncbi:probable endonuclease 4 isoform X4 [Brienomyrus brachyistius]|uniref:probable endonuclease 4 isoform X4 n=1 Tax=Brienomyrus brachyistius TaxID=42636 RepID=UPI0020B2E45F|nr:probable endonuclease 4 isoform X4 [Brienomyrus brachyistius]